MSTHNIQLLCRKSKTHLLYDLALWLTLSGANNPYLELIFMVPRLFEPLRFDCNIFYFSIAYVVNTHLNCLESSRQVEAIQMGTHNICFYTLIEVFQTSTNNMYFSMATQNTIMKTRLFKYIENFTSKNWKFSDKIFWYFSYFCSKHRMWVLVRTASARRF